MRRQKKMIEIKEIKKKVNGKEISIGAVLESQGSTSQTKTGSWRALKPIIDFKRCTGCGLCWVFCPEGCIFKKKDGKFKVNYDYCKGCGICSNECPVKAIKMIKEEK